MKMAKIVILLAVILTFKGSYGTSFGGLEDVVEEFGEAFKELTQVNDFISYLSTGYQDYELTIIDTLSKTNIYSVFEDLENSIQEAETQTSENAIHCIDSAWRQAMIASDELRTQVDNCVLEAREVGEEVKQIIQDLELKSTNIEKKGIDDYSKCMDEETSENSVKCLSDLVHDLRENLKVLKEEVRSSNIVVHEKETEEIKNLKVCLQEVKNDLNLKKDHIEEDLEQCIKAESKYFFNYGTRSVIDIIKDLKQKIDAIIFIVTHLPTVIEEIPDKIKEFISHLNINILVSQLKKEINEIINDGGAGAAKCRSFADEQIEDLQKSAEEDANKCGDAAKDQVAAIKDGFVVLGDEAKQILADLKTQIHQCFKDNGIHLQEYYKCLEKHIGIFQDRVGKLQEKAIEAYDNAKQEADKIVKVLATCVNKVQINTVNKSQALIENVENCVKNIRHKYYM